VATRHIWYTDFKAGFVKHIDTLLNQNIMVGPGVSCRESLLPLAHSVLVDLIHHVRTSLSVPQLAKTIVIFSRNLNDPAFAPNIQTMCAKLLLNLSEILKELPNKATGAVLLYRILDAYALRYASLAKHCPTVATFLRHPTSSVEHPRLEFALDLGIVQPCASCLRASLEGSVDLLRDIKFLFKNLVLGTKTIVFALRSMALPKVAPNPVFPTVFLEGLGCFDYYSPALFDRNKEDKEVLEAFASIFTFIEPHDFQNLIHLHLPVLFEAILRNPALIIIPQFFLANPAVSCPFAGHLLQFLMAEKLGKLGGREATADHCNIVIRLFKLLFMAVTLFPDKNEAMLRPSLGSLITTALTLAQDAPEPAHLFLLLRALFRSIGGGRFGR
jgi:transformation/transcription domain-associated protein